MKIKEELTIEVQKVLVHELFGFELIDTGNDHYVLYDEDGDEFYGFNENLNYDFSTLAGMFEYSQIQAKKRGIREVQDQIKKALGL